MNEVEQYNNKRIKQKSLLNQFIDRPVNYLIDHEFAPNTLSYLGFLCSISAAFFIAIGLIHYSFWLAWLVPFLMCVGGAFDVFDGEVARRTNKETKTGAFLDSNIDRISDVAIILALIYGGLMDFLIGFIITFLTIMISYIRARAENEGVDMKGIGLMERAERLIILIIALNLETWIYFLSWFITGTPFTLFFPIFTWIFMGLLVITVIQRIIHSFKKLKN